MNIFDKAHIENGILRVHVDSFDQLFKFGQIFHQSTGQYYFRGQSNEQWGLTTTLERFESELNNFVKGTQEHVLREFKRLIRGKGLLSTMALSSDEEFWALGQHYGLPTPLLDWSESFYIALFFAFAQEIPDDVENAALWAIQMAANEVMDLFNEGVKHTSAGVDGRLDKVLPLKFVDPITDVNDRLISQSGIFLQKPSGLDIEEIIEIFCKDNVRAPILAKITIPTKERANILNNLSAMNINWSTIYPGIEGAAMHAKMKLQLLDIKARKLGPKGIKEHARTKVVSFPDAPA